MSWTLVQKKVVSGSAAGSTVSFDSNTTAGNLLLAIPAMNIASQTTLPTVPSFTVAEERLGTNCGVGIWYDIADTGPRSVQASGMTGSTSLAIAEWSHSATGNPTLDQHTDNAITAGTDINGLLGTLASNDELVVMGVRLSGSRTTSVGWSNSFVEQHDLNTRGAWATKVVTSTAGLGATYTWTGTLNAASAMASFRVVSTPLVNRVKVRESNAWVIEASKVRQSNAWVTIT